MDKPETSKKWGNSQEQAIRRLKKFQPDLLEKAESGELSYSQAMIQAGFKSRGSTGLIRIHYQGNFKKRSNE